MTSIQGGPPILRSTGIVRRIDRLGRVVLPVELRRTLQIQPGDRVRIDVDGESIVLSKDFPRCLLCGRSEELLSYAGKSVCRTCVAGVSERS